MLIPTAKHTILLFYKYYIHGHFLVAFRYRPRVCCLEITLPLSYPVTETHILSLEWTRVNMAQIRPVHNY